MRLHKHQTTTTNTISRTTGTTTAIIIIVPLESSSSLLDTSPGGLVLADDVGDVAMELFELSSVELSSDAVDLVDCAVRLVGVVGSAVATGVRSVGFSSIYDIYFLVYTDSILYLPRPCKMSHSVVLTSVLFATLV